MLDPDTKELVKEDLARMTPHNLGEEISSLRETLRHKSSFRSIMKYRIINSKNPKALRCFKMCLWLYPAESGIEIDGKIEGGLRIVHHCCVVSVERAGKNLSLGPFVVVGKKHGSAPKIGDNVTICANATVVGNIVIGDNALIGAGAFVDKDVPAGARFVGNPARPLEKKAQ